jgi:hypothetical protein
MTRQASAKDMGENRQVDVPRKLVSLASRIVQLLDRNDPDTFIDADDAVQCSYGSGGRIAPGRFFIALYLRDETWNIKLDELALRRLAAGLTKKVHAAVSTKPTPEARERVGEAFAIWGDEADERCRVPTLEDMEGILRALSFRATTRPASAVFGSTHGDVVYLALSGDMAYVGAVLRGGSRNYCSSQGGDAQDEPCAVRFPLLDEPVPLTFSDFVPIATALPLTRGLVLTGEVDESFPWVEQMHGELLITLPIALRSRGYFVPLAGVRGEERSDRNKTVAEALPRLSSTGLALETIRARASAPPRGARESFGDKAKRRAIALVEMMLSSGDIELRGAHSASIVIDKVTSLLESVDDRELEEQDLAAEVFNMLLDTPDVREVFLDEKRLSVLLGTHGTGS